jgi:hypothetical protein
MAKAAAVLGALGAAQYALGEGENFFDHKFVTTKSSQDLAGTFCRLSSALRLNCADEQGEPEPSPQTRCRVSTSSPA